MKILYNPDGSVNKIELSNYVNQNNNNVDEICVAILGKEPSEYIATAYFTLPTGDTNFLTITNDKTFTIGDDPTEYVGKSFYLTNQQTVYAGVLSMTIEFVSAANPIQHLFTYNTKITINPTGVLPDETDITLSEYDRIVEALAGKIESSTARITAMDSGITSQKVYTYDAAVTTLGQHVSNSNIHVTLNDKDLWNNKTRVIFSTSAGGVVDPEPRSYVTVYDNQGNPTTYQLLPASDTSTVPWLNISGSDPQANVALKPHVFNVIPASDIPFNVLTAEDYAKITNGNPTRITGTISGYTNLIVYITNGDSTYNYGSAKATDSNGVSVEISLKISKATREIVFGTNSYGFDTDENFKVSGDSELDGDVDVTGDVGVGGDLDVGGDFTVGQKSIVDIIYPVGSIYMSVANTNPGTLFPNTTWEALPGRFLLGAGQTSGTSNSYNGGDTGGSANAVAVNHGHTASFTGTTSETGDAGAHSHTVSIPNDVDSSNMWCLQEESGGDGNVTYTTSSAPNHKHSFTPSGSVTVNDLTGEDGVGKNMPPYLVVYMWKRTA